MLNIIRSTCLNEDSEAVEKSATEKDEDDVGREQEGREAGPRGKCEDEEDDNQETYSQGEVDLEVREGHETPELDVAYQTY